MKPMIMPELHFKNISHQLLISIVTRLEKVKPSLSISRIITKSQTNAESHNVKVKKIESHLLIQKT